MKKICQRCNTEFECRNNCIKKCECFNVMLTLNDLVYIAQRYSNCLCKDCLLQLKRERMAALQPDNLIISNFMNQNKLL